MDYKMENEVCPNSYNQDQEINFSCKIATRNHTDLVFNNNTVNVTTMHKHLGGILDSTLSTDKH